MSSGAEDYGTCSQQPDIAFDDYKEQVLRHIEVLEDAAEDVESTERDTRGQYDNIRWLYLSRKLLMDRHFGRVYKLKKGTSPANAIMEITRATNMKPAFLEYQMRSKEQALKDFQQIKKVQVRHSRNVTPAEAIKRKMSSVHTWFNKEMTEINWNCNVYYRAIGAMGISEAESCIFIFWTPKGMLTLSIKRNVYVWEKMVPILNKFYDHFLLHEIIDSRLDRSMPVRGLNEQMVISGIDDSERADFIVSLPDISTVCIKTNSVSNSDRLHGRIKHRHGTDVILTCQDMLTSDQMDMFQEICRNFTDGFYEQQSCLLIQRPQMIKPACPFKKHVQILNVQNQHWVCSYYDTKKIYIFDSMNGKTLKQDCRDFLENFVSLFEADPETVPVAISQDEIGELVPVTEIPVRISQPTCLQLVKKYSCNKCEYITVLEYDWERQKFRGVNNCESCQAKSPSFLSTIDAEDGDNDQHMIIKMLKLRKDFKQKLAVFILWEFKSYC
ncbi:hypothetical protein PV325_005311 [Microctonus aethiopoides]|nr:hypothetical protein PV325_005311 [Microctonus aethiopoides]